MSNSNLRLGEKTFTDIGPSMVCAGDCVMCFWHTLDSKIPYDRIANLLLLTSLWPHFTIDQMFTFHRIKVSNWFQEDENRFSQCVASLFTVTEQ